MQFFISSFVFLTFCIAVTFPANDTETTASVTSGSSSSVTIHSATVTSHSFVVNTVIATNPAQVKSNPFVNRTVNGGLGWPLEIECKLDVSDVTWHVYDKSIDEFEDLISSIDYDQFYVISQKILFIPVLRAKYENNSIFKCSGPTGNSDTVQIVVSDCHPDFCQYGRCLTVNRGSGVPIADCQCDDGYEGTFCDSKVASASTYVLMVVGSIFSLCMFILAGLVLKKRKKDDIVRKVDANKVASKKA